MIRITIIIMGLFFSSIATAAYNFNWYNLMLAHTKLSENFDYENYVDSYMRKYRHEVWSKYKNDEFDLEDKRQETINIIKEKVRKFDLNKEFTIYYNLKFEKYNFERELFPINGFSETFYFYEKENSVGSYPSKYKVFFTNHQKLGDLPMSKDKAKKFLKSRKDRNGYVNRSIYAKIVININKLGGEPSSMYSAIKNITIYSDKSKAKQLISF
ncbi:DUF4852 domain-containing protein [Endozoicomonas sp. OPT23]|uniref:DUF4852 domain-containing protein n=1 Tax=Endozoicomonas sp. OPT23 TaxID=2072845 RepID=UPI00129B65DA|nr:DUF4852 domain-containing protein [Endozoicomonas sp. OPT23]MRI32501.1 DUF4852 domain-containing protein [Endozoicomonas sp. OPT23]